LFESKLHQRKCLESNYCYTNLFFNILNTQQLITLNRSFIGDLYTNIDYIKLTNKYLSIFNKSFKKKIQHDKIPFKSYWNWGNDSNCWL